MKYTMKHLFISLLLIAIFPSCTILNKNSNFSKEISDSTLINSENSALASLGWNTYINNQNQELKEKISTPEIKINREQNSLKITIPCNLAFTTNNSTVNPIFFDDLNSIISVFLQYSESIIIISSFTDNTGSSEYNENLSKDRADSISSYMQRRGIDSNRITPIGYGSNPNYFITDNSTLEKKSLNRRIEIVVLPPSDY